MKVPDATSLERSAAASCSAAAGGGKTYGKKKKPECNAEPGAEHSAEDEDRDAAPKFVHGHSPVGSG